MKRNNGVSKILASKSIIVDTELVKFIGNAAQYDAVLAEHLRRAIDLTKSDKSDCAAIYAANSATILVAAYYSFAGQDLSHINIRGANIRGGYFSGANFTGADLSFTNLANIQADDATLVKANLRAVKFGILPKLKGHTDYVSSVSFSVDGKYIASGSVDNSVKIWKVETSKCVSTLNSHTGTVNCVSYSPDGRYLASGSEDQTVKIWDAKTFECLTTLQHEVSVQNVSFSGDGKYLVSYSSDSKIRSWDVATSKCLAAISKDFVDFEFSCIVYSMAVSLDGKYSKSSSKSYIQFFPFESTKF